MYTGGKTEEGKTLKKGDCATKGEIDNPNTGKKIKVTNKMNGTTATFYKRDNGKPDGCKIAGGTCGHRCRKIAEGL